MRKILASLRDMHQSNVLVREARVPHGLVRLENWINNNMSVTGLRHGLATPEATDPVDLTVCVCYLSEDTG